MKQWRTSQLVSALGVALVMTAGGLSAETVQAGDSPDLGWGPTHVTWESEAIFGFMSIGDYLVESRRTKKGSITTLMGSELQPIVRLVDASNNGHTLRLDVRTGRKKRRKAKTSEWRPVARLALQEEQARPLVWSALQLVYLWDTPDFVREVERYAQKTRRGSRARRRGARLPLVKTQWQGGLLRPVAVESEQRLANEFLGETGASTLVYDDMFASSEKTGSGFRTTLWKRSPGDHGLVTEEPNGPPLGLLVWNSTAERMSFSFGEQVSAGVWTDLDASVLPGGHFPFEPSMAWAEIQIRQSWFQFLRATARAASQTKAAGSLPRTNLDTIGCDGLHFLDNSSLRPCCDQHDLCYMAGVTHTGAACSYVSWFWPFCGQTPGCNWRCQQCNISAVVCFPLNLVFNPLCQGCLYVDFMWGNPGSYCHLDGPGYCPPECIGCTW